MKKKKLLWRIGILFIFFISVVASPSTSVVCILRNEFEPPQAMELIARIDGLTVVDTVVHNTLMFPMACCTTNLDLGFHKLEVIVNNEIIYNTYFLCWLEAQWLETYIYSEIYTKDTTMIIDVDNHFIRRYYQ